jgi:dephospho-CoA kinase
VRYQRFLERKEKKEDGSESLKQFLAQEKEWIEKEIPKQGIQADFRIDNAGTREELYKKVDAIINKLT